jgi:hypothetical protein
MFNLYRQRVKSDISNSQYANEDIMQTIKDEFYDMPNHYKVYKNGISSTLYDVVINEGDKDEKVLGYKKLISYPYDTPKFDCGDLIYWNNEIWLLATLDKQHLYGVKGRIIQCNNTITFTKNSTSYSVPCVVQSLGQSLGLGISDTNYITSVNNTIYIRLQKNSVTQLIGINDIFSVGMWHWKCENINDVLEPNILILRFKWVEETPPTTTTEQKGWW